MTPARTYTPRLELEPPPLPATVQQLLRWYFATDRAGEPRPAADRRDRLA